MTTLSEKAQELLEGRKQAVEQLGSAHEELEALEARYAEEMATAQRKVSDAYKAATSAGWTERELRVLGVQRPTSQRAGRAPATRAKRRTTSRGTSASADSTEVGEAV